jgi:hypothetical protein
MDISYISSRDFPFVYSSTFLKYCISGTNYARQICIDCLCLQQTFKPTASPWKSLLELIATLFSTKEDDIQKVSLISIPISFDEN